MRILIGTITHVWQTTNSENGSVGYKAVTVTVGMSFVFNTRRIVVIILLSFIVEGTYNLYVCISLQVIVIIFLQ